VSQLAPLAVAVPMLAAAALAAGAHRLPARADDLLGIAVAGTTAVLCALLLHRSAEEPIAYWYGGWEPRQGGVALGISFAVEPLGAALALLAAVLTTAAFVFSWRFFDEVGTLFHVLVLVFLGALVGFALTADLFNLFVFFELASVSAFALTAYGVGARGSLQGAINFAVTNTIGAILILTGLALVYGRTGALNLAQIGDALAERESDGLVVVAFALLAVGLLVKAGAVPFHFWLADAYAVAPVPVCVLFAGIMSDLGLHGLAKVYWAAFAGPLGPHEEALRAVLVGLGVLTALLGGVMALLERDLKRLLAFATVSHIGVFLTGIALLTPRGLAGTTVYVVADGLVKGALFLVVGILVYRLGSGDELALHGRGGRAPVAGAVLLAAGIATAGLPPFGPFLGKSLLEDAALDVGYGWLPAALSVAVALSAAAVLRAGARIFLGWGPKRDPLLTPQAVEARDEEPEPRRISPAALVAPAAVLLLAGLGIGLAPGLAGGAERHAVAFEDRDAYAAWLLRGEVPEIPPARAFHPGTADVAAGLGATAGALALAALLLWRRRLPGAVRELLARPLSPAVARLRLVHSGRVGDYVAWLTVGAAALGGLFAVALR
jgi:multicomponent Na+:H+ antiporter subunit D